MHQYEYRIEELIGHHNRQYRYVGERGEEYEVIQSIFHEINRLTEVSNPQIRWYAVILHLIDSYYNWRVRGGLPDSLFPETADGVMAVKRLAMVKSCPQPTPPYMLRLESYITEIARLGIIVSAGGAVCLDFLCKKVARIRTRLADLLSAMSIPAAAGFPESQEDAFILAVRQATDNVLKLAKAATGEINPGLTDMLHSPIYRQLILKRIDTMDEKRLSGLFHLDALWNGFIP